VGVRVVICTPNLNSLALIVSEISAFIRTDSRTRLVILIKNIYTLWGPSACYILSDESRIPFYSASNGYKYKGVIGTRKISNQKTRNIYISYGKNQYRVGVIIFRKSYAKQLSCTCIYLKTVCTHPKGTFCTHYLYKGLHLYTQKRFIPYAFIWNAPINCTQECTYTTFKKGMFVSFLREYIQQVFNFIFFYFNI